jgi:nucleoside-diphosphate-sugar epimerase
VSRALILGGTGLIGRATARRLLAAGWQVDLTGRDPGRMPADIAAAGGRFHAADRDDPAQLHAALGDGADLLIDCICYTAAHAVRLLPLARAVDSTVMLSSKAVYVDAWGNHSNSPAPPRFAGPIRESQPTMAPGDGDFNSREGYGANKVAAENVLLDSGLPVTIVRPSRVHGPDAVRPREWYFVKRALDRRPAVLLPDRGADVVHTTAAANIAALIKTVAAAPGRRILNSADPDAPTALEISRTIARLLGHERAEVFLPAGAGDALGEHPWRAPHPVVLDLTAAEELGYRPAGDYAATVADEVRWLTSIARTDTDAAAGGPGAQLPPGFDPEYFESLFDYAAEDRYLAARSG